MKKLANLKSGKNEELKANLKNGKNEKLKANLKNGKNEKLKANLKAKQADYEERKNEKTETGKSAVRTEG